MDKKNSSVFENFSKIFLFKPKNLPILTRETALEILNAKNYFACISLNLGLSKEKVFVRDEYVEFPGGFKIKKDLLEEVAEDESKSVYVIENSNIRSIERWDSKENTYYKLKYVKPDTAPTLEINGIHMHRIVNITPWQDSAKKVRLLRVRPREKVLDICTGLGYTAILAHKMGGDVVSIEKSVSVLKIAEYNPWSKELEQIKIILGDAFKTVKKFEEKTFNKILHDPPRFSLAGELYSLSFYKELYRILKAKGLLVHYVGSPGRCRGIDMVRGVAQRLKNAGFTVYINRKLECVVAVKEK
jgi:hypothetical protein